MSETSSLSAGLSTRGGEGPIRTLFGDTKPLRGPLCEVQLTVGDTKPLRGLLQRRVRTKCRELREHRRHQASPWASVLGPLFPVLVLAGDTKPLRGPLHALSSNWSPDHDPKSETPCLSPLRGPPTRWCRSTSDHAPGVGDTTPLRGPLYGRRDGFPLAVLPGRRHHASPPLRGPLYQDSDERDMTLEVGDTMPLRGPLYGSPRNIANHKIVVRLTSSANVMGQRRGPSGTRRRSQVTGCQTACVVRAARRCSRPPRRSRCSSWRSRPGPRSRSTTRTGGGSGSGRPTCSRSRTRSRSASSWQP